MEAKNFLRFVRTDQCYTPLCIAFGCMELELNPLFKILDPPLETARVPTVMGASYCM